MIDKTLINDNITGIQKLLKDIASYKSYALDEIKADVHLYASLRYLFIELINRAIDINQHLIKELNGPVPQDYAETFKLLGKLNILKNDLATSIAKSAGLRNVVVHEYRDIDDEKLYNSIDIALDEYPRYIQAVLDYISQH